MNIDQLKRQLSVKAKNGVDFITAATLLWVSISIIWSLDLSTYHKSVFTFMISGVMLPLAFLFSKVYKTQWNLRNNALQPLGIWLNLAQLLYFPFLVFILLKMPEYFVMGYAIITGAHFFPYAWFYNEMAYVVAGGLISIGSFIMALYIEATQMYYIPTFTSIVLLLLGLTIYASAKKKAIDYQE